ncbi:MAG: HAD-IC family P-type ATPase [Patescibacteria group bacterium]
MEITELINYINAVITRLSAWLFSVRNTQHTSGPSNYILIGLALFIIITGVIAEWIVSNPRRRAAFLRWWRHQPLATRLVTGYTRPDESDTIQTNVSIPKVVALHPTGASGLTDDQVRERLAKRQVNASHPRTSRSYRHILFTNIFTRFNALLGGMYTIILWVGATQDSLFGLIIVFNALIGIIQELRAKWTLDRLALVITSNTQVVRNGSIQTIPTNHIVIDDVIVMKTGDQVPVDGTVTQTSSLEANESMVTGESEPVTKKTGDALYSGSFIVAGTCRMQAVHIGEHAYARRLANAVRQFTLSKSELRIGINKILRYITWILAPAGVLLFATQLFFQQNGWRDALSASAGGVVNMIPDGLVLLTSVVMAVAVVRLAKQRVLIQELPAVEMLARVDTLCLDKTGTLTEGSIAVENIRPVDRPENLPAVTPKDVLGIFTHEQERTATMDAIGKACPYPNAGDWTVRENIPFSSSRKWSAITFERHGTWLLGAAEMIMAGQKMLPTLSAEIERASENGKRVLLLAYSPHPLTRTKDNTFSIRAAQPAAIITLQEQLRPGVEKTLQYFKDQGVAVKIISGDNPRTVASVARRAGIMDNDPLNGQHLPTDADALANVIEQHSVFGRILPEQKKSMVQALQKRGHVVAMVGDGVNDVLAIKEADFSIAMGAGTEASRGTAQLVLLDNNFLALPEVIAEGRRIIANIERTANLFITKAAYVVTIALAVGMAGVPFPFLPRHLTVIAFFTVGVPSLFLSFARNNTRARAGFVNRVFNFSLPSGALIAALVLITYGITRQLNLGTAELARTAATLTLFGCGLGMLILLAKPRTLWHKCFIAALIIGMGLTISLPAIRGYFALVWPPLLVWLTTVIGIGLGIIGLKLIKTKFVPADNDPAPS